MSAPKYFIPLCYSSNPKRKAEDDGRDGIEDKKIFTDDDLVKMATKMTIDLDPDQQRLPNEIMEQICEFVALSARPIEIPLDTQALAMPEDLRHVKPAMFKDLDGMFNASRTTRRMLATHMLHRTTFTTRLDLATPPFMTIAAAFNLSKLPDIIRKNIRKIQVQVYFTGPATVNAVEEWTRIWYEPGLLRQTSRIEVEQEVEVRAVTRNWDDSDGFTTEDGRRFWPWGAEIAECFLDDVRTVAEDLVWEENRQAANDPDFVIGVNLPELKKRVANMTADEHCDEHLEGSGWKRNCCWKCFHHEVHAGWARSAGLPEKEVPEQK
ncbi:unnamed protein product [Zymoseptoria tritici ST99CH_3D1]|nr:unnamed protein product [Zymoseptoria tritici ST99CH_3D1]